MSREDFEYAAAWLPATLLLCGLTWQVRATAGPLPMDIHLSLALGALHGPALDAFMHLLHDVQGKLIAIALLATTIAMAWRRRWRALLRFAVVVPGGMLVNSGLKLLVARERPALLAASIGSHGFAYPSGHVAAITLCCGTLVLGTWALTPRRRWRLAAVLAAAATVAAVAASRVYLGVHLPSDVAAAVLLGIAWLGLCRHAAQALGAVQARPAAGALAARTMR